MSLFPHEFAPEGEPPREWYGRLYNIQRWTVSAHGGHFAAIEEPDILTEEIRSRTFLEVGRPRPPVA